jgi:hypothetical protein
MRIILAILLSLLSFSALADQPHKVEGIIRWTSGGTPYVLNDADHAPVGVNLATGASVSGNYIVIPFSECFTKLNTFFAVPDDTLATSYHMHTGASGGLCNMSIAMGKEGTAGAFSPTGVTNTSANINFGVYGLKGGETPPPPPPPDNDGWVTIYDVTISNYSNGWVGATLLDRLPASKFSNIPTGTLSEIRVTTIGGTTEGFQSGAVTVCHQATSGDAYDCSATPTALTTGGSGSGTSPQNGTIAWVGSFSYDKASDLIIGTNCTGSTSVDQTRADYSNTGGALYEKSSSADAGVQNRSGFSAYANARGLTVKIEVR